MVRRELEKEDRAYVWLQSIRQQEKDDLMIKTKEAIRKKLKQDYEYINEQLDAKKRAARDPAVVARIDVTMQELLTNYGKVIGNFMITELEFEPGTSLEMRRNMRECAREFKDILNGFQEFITDIANALLL